MQPYALFRSTQSPNPVGPETTKPDFRMPDDSSRGNQSELRDGEINESAVEIIIPIIVASINAPINGGKKL